MYNFFTYFWGTYWIWTSESVVLQTRGLNHSPKVPLHIRKDLNPQPLVLETTALPIELLIHAEVKRLELSSQGMARFSRPVIHRCMLTSWLLLNLIFQRTLQWEQMESNHPSHNDTRFTVWPASIYGIYSHVVGNSGIEPLSQALQAHAWTNSARSPKQKPPDF